VPTANVSGVNTGSTTPNKLLILCLHEEGSIQQYQRCAPAWCCLGLARHTYPALTPLPPAELSCMQPCGGAIPLCMVQEFDLPMEIIDRKVRALSAVLWDT